jgi:regulator of protease activity HflC (stomatin/prohibitin superfamily)
MQPTPFTIFKFVFGGFIAILALSALISSATQIDAGEQGVVTRFGKVQGETLGSGYHWVAPFIDDVKIFSIREEKIEAGAAAASRDLQTVNATVAVNLRLDPSKINDLYRTVGTDWQSRIVDPAIQEVVKATTAQFTAEELITRRPEVSAAITQSLSDRLARNNILIQNVSITNFDFSKAFNDAIEAKQVAQQNVAKATQELEQAKVDVQKTIASAQAQAEAQRLQQQTLTPDLLQKYAIEKWNGALPTYITGGQTPFINIPVK